MQWFTLFTWKNENWKKQKAEYVIHVINLKQALNHGSVLWKEHRIIKFVQKAWLNSYFDIIKPAYLGLSILELSKIGMCEFWYSYIKRN